MSHMHEFTPEAVSRLATKFGAHLESFGEELAHTIKAATTNVDPDAGLIFVTGGTGVIGYRVATRLLHAGYPKVRVGALHFDHAEGLNKEGAEIADFSWTRPDTYATALEGVQSVLCTVPPMKNFEKLFPKFLKVCKEKGVKHIVKLSFYHARKTRDMFHDVPLVQSHAVCDTLLVNSGMFFTILSASHFMSNPLVYQGTELHKDTTPVSFYGASGERGVNYVSPNDVAEVAVRTLLEPKTHFDREYTLTGPAAITNQEVANMLGVFLSKPVMYIDQNLLTFEMASKMDGEPAWWVQDMVALEKVKATGKEEDASFVTKHVEKITGHPAQTFQEYLEWKDAMTPEELA
jgi:uncharacterized protein YbjT (DUF2867 family)